MSYGCLLYDRHEEYGRGRNYGRYAHDDRVRGGGIVVGVSHSGRNDVYARIVGYPVE